MKGTIPDLDRIPCGNGRRVLVCFDANATTNVSVAAARSMFERELSDRGADVYVVEIPEIDGVNGPDDLIGLWGPGPVVDLIERAYASEVEDCGLIRSLATAIQKADHFAQDGGCLLHRYVKGIYESNAKEFIAKRVKALLEQRKIDSKWSSHRADEVAEYIRLDAPKLLGASISKHPQPEKRVVRPGREAITSPLADALIERAIAGGLYCQRHMPGLGQVYFGGVPSRCAFSCL